MNAIIALAMKDLRLLWRDKPGLFWVIGFPLLNAILFGAIFGGGGGGGNGKIDIFVVDEDNTEVSQNYVADLVADDGLSVTTGTLNQAEANVRKGRAVAYVLLNKGYGEGFGPFDFAGGADAKPKMEIGIDPSRKAEASMLQGMLIQKSFQGIGDSFANPAKFKTLLDGTRKSVADSPDLSMGQRLTLSTFLGQLESFSTDLDRETKADDAKSDGKPVKKAAKSGGPGLNIPMKEVRATSDGPKVSSAYDITFPSGILWGIVGCVSAFAISLVIERRQGTLMRLRAAPLTQAHVLAGKGLACFLACGMVIAMLTLLGQIPVFSVHVADPAKYLAAAICTMLCFVGLMMLISTLGKTENSVAGAGWAILLIAMMLGGGMIPQFAMPGWMISVGQVSPCFWAIRALEGAIWRGYSWTEMLVPCVFLLSVGTAAFIVGAARMRRMG